MIPETNFAHLIAMTSTYGTFEHADLDQPRIKHGHCTDDVARALVVTMREVNPSPDVISLAWNSMQYLLASQSPSGHVMNRRSSFGTWFGNSSAEDCWGRSMWAFGTAAARSTDEAMRSEVLRAFARGSQVQSPWPRANAFAVLGAAEVLGRDPENLEAHFVLANALPVLDRPEVGSHWPWPEDRLEYANAVLPEALLVIGQLLGVSRLIRSGIRQLSWLLETETFDGHLSVTPVGGRGPNDEVRRFVQQSVEAAAMADACVRAYAQTNDGGWVDGLNLAVDWFAGANDLGVPMFDPITGGGYDGLTASGPNLNQGTDSTIALLTTTQLAHRFATALQ